MPGVFGELIASFAGAVVFVLLFYYFLEIIFLAKDFFADYFSAPPQESQFRIPPARDD
jgi:hypothetical protein